MSFAFESARPTGVRPSPIFLAVIGVAVAAGTFVWNSESDTPAARFAVFLFVVAGWIVTLCLHEFAHAFLAWRFGDHEVEARGYLTLNPLKYSHPVLSILLPVVFIALGGIGLPGGAVYVHPNRFRTNRQRALVSLAGPAVNVVFAITLLILLRMFQPSSTHPLFWIAVAFSALLQITAMILNLLPIPGLDGFGAIEPYLDPSTQRSLETFKPWGMLVIFVLLFQVPALNRAFFDLAYGLFELSGIPSIYASAGFELVKFWAHT